MQDLLDINGNLIKPDEYIIMAMPWGRSTSKLQRGRVTELKRNTDGSIKNLTVRIPSISYVKDPATLSYNYAVGFRSIKLKELYSERFILDPRGHEFEMKALERLENDYIKRG